MAIIMSTPLACLSLYSVLVCGLASAMAAAAIQKIRVVTFSAPAMSLGFVPSDPIMESEEKVILAGVPSLPLSMSNGGIAKRSRNHHGCAKLRL